MLQKISGTLPNIKIIRITRNLCKRPNTANVHFHFPLRNLQPQTCGLMYKFHEEMNDIWKCWKRLEVLRTFNSKNIGEPIEYTRCLPLPCFNKFVLTQKKFNCFFVTKQYQAFRVSTGGDGLMKFPCSGLLSSIEVGLCYLRKWRRGELLLFVLKQAQSM